MWSPVCISFLSVMPLLSTAQPDSQPPWANIQRCLPLSILGDQSLCLNYGDICLYPQRWAVSGSLGSIQGQALILIFQRHKGQSLLGYCTFSAFIWNLVHTKLEGLGPAPPKSIPGKIIQEEVEEVQYHMWSLFLLTEQGTSAWCSNGPSVFMREDGRGGHYIHWALTRN